MSSAAIVALRARVASNTLTIADQAALTTALDAIAPTFQEPDETSVIRFSDEEEAREWIAALYWIQALGTGGGGTVVSGTILAADGPALSAEAVLSLPTGQPAQVESFGAEFSLQPIGSMVVDGSTVLATLDDPTRVWERGDTLVAEQAVLQTAWEVDPASGNNNNTGAVGFPLKQKAEIARRYGTWSPTLSGVNVVVAYLGPDTDDSDPGLFAPILKNGATFLEFVVSPAASFTGTLLAVTPKAGNNPLASTFTVATGAVVASMLLINTTRGNSRGFAQRNLGGGNWRITQPFAPDADPTNPGRTPVNTWANGDSIEGFVLPNINIALCGGLLDTFASSGAFGHTLAGMTIWDPNGTAGGDPLTLDGESNPCLNTCVNQRTLGVRGSSTFGLSVNTLHIDDFAPVRVTCPLFFFEGGCIGGAVAPALGLSYAEQPILQQDVLITQPLLECRNAQLSGNVALDFAGAIQFVGDTEAQSAPGIYYGSGIINQRQGSFRYAGAASAQLVTTGGLQLNGVATGYSVVTLGGTSTVHGGIALTAANLDNPAGAAGFGGYAFGGAAAFVRNGAQP